MELAAQVDFGYYPSLGRFLRGFVPIHGELTSVLRTRWSAAVRYRFRPFELPVDWLRDITPYAHAGISVLTGRVNGTPAIGVGPSLGTGIEYGFLGLPVLVFYEMAYALSLPDRGIDRAGSDGSTADGLFLLSAGLRYRFARPVAAPRMIMVSAPAVLEAGSFGWFTATVDAGSDPVSVRWLFSDGSSDVGETVRHAFAVPGTYRVEVVVDDGKNRRTSAAEVQVTAPPAPVEVSAIVVSPLRPRAGEPVQFRPIIRGSQYQCRWEFGDGNGSDECEPDHAFGATGVFTFRLTVSSAGHVVTQHRDLQVENDRCQTVSSLHSVTFPQNSADVAAAMRDLLRENVETLTACPGRRIRIVGSAGGDEVDPGSLANRRALAVFQFYRLMGIPSGRFQDVLETSIGSAGAAGWQARSARTELY